MNFSLEKNVEILAYHVERFTYLRDNEQYQDADAIAQNMFVMAKLKMITINGYTLTINSRRKMLMTREQELEQQHQDFQEWLNKCPLVVTDYQDFTDQFQVTFNLEAD